MNDITLYFWPTPNCYKISIMLEELAQDYEVEPIHIGKGAQFAANYLKKSPNAKVPAIEDRSETKPKYIFESGAILFYLAEKHNKFLGEKTTDKIDVIQWLMFQMGNLGPLLGQAHHFRFYAKEKIEYPIQRYTQEASKLYSVLDKQLSKNQYIAGDAYSIADMAIYPWLRPYKMQGQNIADHQNLQRWYTLVRSRPGVQRGLSVMDSTVKRDKNNKPDGEAWNNLFAKKKL